MQTTLNTLVNFNGTNGSQPITGNLIADAHGNLFGTTASGGTFNHGTVFEIAHGSGHITTVVSFNGANGDLPIGTLSIDANGNLFGTTEFGGQFGDGTVFEIAKTSLGYDPNPITLVSFNQANGQSPEGGVIADANGNLFGTTAFGGASFEGTVFELVKSGSTYTLNTLVSFNGADGALPFGSLIFDGSGDVLGTTFSGGAFDHGTVFGILNTGSGFASTPTTLASFNGTDGAGPSTGSLVIRQWQPVRRHRFWRGEQQRHVFEILNTPFGYDPNPTTLVSFTGTNGSIPAGGLFADDHGNLFGTTQFGGANGLVHPYRFAKRSDSFPLHRGRRPYMTHLRHTRI